MDLETLNRVAPEIARAELLRCCSSTRWAEAVLGRRPFPHDDVLFATAQQVWSGLAPADWLEAFAGHPKIGDRAALAKNSLAEGEQAGAAGAPEAVLARLAAANRAYEERFGYIFIVSATGRSAEEMLALLEARLGNARAAELRMAAAEQAKITRLRLEKLLAS